MNVQIKILDPRAKVPQRGTAMAAGYDLIACIDEPIVIGRQAQAILVPTGISIFMNDGEVAALIMPRSGLGHKQGLVLGNTIGLIDGDYQGQLFVSAWNRGQQDKIVINPGDRIAQLTFIPVLHPTFIQVEEFTKETKRGEGGYGSTGVTA